VRESQFSKTLYLFVTTKQEFSKTRCADMSWKLHFIGFDVGWISMDTISISIYAWAFYANFWLAIRNKPSSVIAILLLSLLIGVINMII
jgi:hypothetical protein